MIPFGRKVSPEVRTLLDRERAIAAQPAVVRARALARARAALTSASKPAAYPVSAAAQSRRRWAAAAAVLCVLGAGVGAAAYQIRVRLTPLPSSRGADPTIVRAPAAAVVAPSLPPIANPIDDSPAPPARATVPRSKTEVAQAQVQEELRLLRQARAAVARSDFAAALPLLAEHARRFKDGSLAEEREALRVRALAGLDRIDEARRAAAAFGARFPRSVLLPAVNQMATPGAP
ncbi:MAG TPA: hypothetical protein VFG23_00305 [Polyangia bacterium]|nr:hypothetical protein [Polyangia bacterium]